MTPAPPTGALSCPHCGQPVRPDDEFCESCGNDLNGAGRPAPTGPGPGEGIDQPPPAESPATEQESARTHLLPAPGADAEDGTPGEPAAAEVAAAEVAADGPTCAECGGAVGPDGWCTVCGARAGNGREHVTEQPSPTVAAVSDLGRLHPRNEDAFAIATEGDWAALVVCDGVTSSTDSDVASQAAARAGRDVLVAGGRPASTSGPGGRAAHWSTELVSAARAADAAAKDAAEVVGPSSNPPSCTFVAAVADGRVLAAAWLGDSRAYWLPDQGPAQQLTVDDSWATEAIRAGIDPEVAEADTRAHAITRWLGVDSPEVDASASSTTAAGPGWLLVCSDGLWNYCSAASDLAHLVASITGTAGLTGDDAVGDTPAGLRRSGATVGDDPLALAEALVAWANEQGGHDNITAALARVVPVPTDTEDDRTVELADPTADLAGDDGEPPVDLDEDRTIELADPTAGLATPGPDPEGAP